MAKVVHIEEEDGSSIIVVTDGNTAVVATRQDFGTIPLFRATDTGGRQIYIGANEDACKEAIKSVFEE